MTTRRTIRLASQIKDEVSVVINQELRDPRIGFVTVTAAQISADLKYTKVFVSIFGDATEKENVLKGLNHAAGYIRHKISERLNLRYTPEISFAIDESVEHGNRIEKLIEDLKTKPS